MEKLGYHFNEARLKEDLENRYWLEFYSANQVKLKPSKQAVLESSVNRLRKHQIDYYFRKVRSDKKK